jgi:hypothetical protein
MDTRDISELTYKAILEEAEVAHHDLALQFGLLAKICTDEEDYIEKARQLAKLMLQYPEEDIDAIFLADPLTKEQFHQVLHKISYNIAEL